MKKLLEYQKKINNLNYTIGLLHWELNVVSSDGSKDDIIDLISIYEKKLFKLKTSKKYKELLENAMNTKEYQAQSTEVKRYLSKLLKNFNNNENIPIKFYSEYVELQNKAVLVWKEAKEKSNYSLFKPYLKKLINMTKKYYQYINSDNVNLYDAMLNDYEEKMTSDIIDPIFEKIKKSIIPLVPKEKKETKFRYNYQNSELLECAKFLLNYIGVDLDRTVVGIFSHGYTSCPSPNDVRIAFRYTTNPFDYLTTVIHEGGHAIYYQNFNSELYKYDYLTVDTLHGLHESQSRFYENILGRNINFWIPIYDKIKEFLHLDMSLPEFMSNLNICSSSLIRTESDELTYPLHIIIRYEIEKEIFNSDVDIDDLPRIWNNKIKEYLNICVKDDASGILQDIHWAQGNFGYFPSYLLGTIYDGMILKAIQNELGDIDNILKSGRIKLITDYLISHIHSSGEAFNFLEIMPQIGYDKLDSTPIIDYLTDKYKNN